MVSQRGKASRLAFSRHDYVDEGGLDGHAAWLEKSWPSVAGAFASEAAGAFYSHAVNVELNGITVQFATGSARRLERAADRAKADGNDMLAVGIQFDGPIHGEARRRTLTVPAGDLLLLDLSQPSRVTISASRSIQLAIPRALAKEYLGPVRKLHGRIVPAAAATLLVEHLEQLRDAIPTLDSSQERRLARVLLDLLAIALQRSESKASTVGRPRSREPQSIRAGVEASLAQPSITIVALCEKLGVSRSTLARMFRAEGGIEAHLRNLRLAKVKDALLDRGNDDRIGNLATRWGFSDASHLSRAFRARYGVTPSAMRAAAPYRQPAGDTLIPAQLAR